jgi:fucose permease
VRLLVILSGLAFISLGLPDGLLGVAWPSIRASFGRELDELGVLLIAATVGYVVSSFSSGSLLRSMNLGVILALSCLMTSAALAGYAAAPAWLFLIPSAVVLGFGGGAIDAALNTYVASTHGPRTLNWLHACYGIGAAGGPLIMTAVLGRGLPWQRGYMIVGLAQLVLAAAFTGTLRLWPRTVGTASEDQVAATIPATLGLPGARLGIATFIAYAGVEASFGAWTYTLLTVGRGSSPVEAGAVVSVFWGSLTAGRLLAGSLGGLIAVGKMMNGALAGVAGGALLVWLNAGTAVTLIGVLVAGLACGPIFPTLVALTPARLGPAHTANAVGFQIAAAAIGLSVVPAVVGVAADTWGVESIARLLLMLSLVLVLVHRWLDRAAPAATVNV